MKRNAEVGLFTKPSILSAYSRLNLNASCPAVKSNGNLILVHNHRNLARAIGIFQHVFEFAGIVPNVVVLNLLPLLFKSFTSRFCVRSRIFAINQYFISHCSYLLKLKSVRG